MYKQNTHWHSQKIDFLMQELKSRDTGIGDNDARERLRKYGYNTISSEKEISSFNIFLTQFANPLIFILVIAAIISIFLKEYTDAWVIAIAVLVNTIIGFIQENKASRSLNALRKYLKAKAVVIRNGKKKEILQEEVVLGDILLLDIGDKIAADARIINSDSLEVNESVLTGESKSVYKKPGILKNDITLADRTNMVYMGTIVENGTGKVLVCATANNTEFGKIAKSIQNIKEDDTPFQKRLASFGKALGIIIVILSVLIFVGGLLSGIPLVEMFITSVAIAVAAIPEGLPIAITVIFAIGMQRILKDKGLVRKLISAETLGTTTIICTDKTGTLTEGKMKIREIITYEQKQIIRKPLDKIGLSALKIGIIRSDGYIEEKNNTETGYVIHGKSEDRAFIEAGLKFNLYKDDIEKRLPLIDEIKYKSGSNFSMSLHKYQRNKNILYVMGAPEYIVGRSKFIESSRSAKTIDKKNKQKIINKYETLTKEGLRVLSVAYKVVSQKKITQSEKDFVFVGFISLEDPLRESVKSAIELCKSAGIRPIIITGDHKLTARYIAKQVDLPHDDKNIIEGSEIKTLNAQRLADRIGDIYVYARTEPSQKLDIVQAWQKKGQVVAMTGDGVNDAPAIKQADVGIALGSGTEVAKEVSDLVLLKDDFSVIVYSIEEGRAIIDNVRKVITYLMSDSFTELILISCAIIFRFPIPVVAAQILWVNLIEDSFPAIALAFEPKENDLMQQKPESRDIPLLNDITKPLIFIISITTNVFLLAIFFWLYKIQGYNIVHARSVIFAALAIDSLFYVFACKSLRNNIWNINLFSNMYLIGAFLIGILLLSVSLYLPALQALLQTVPLTIIDLAILLGFGLIKLLIIETIKYFYIIKNR